MSMKEFDTRAMNVISTLQICGANGWRWYHVLYKGWYIIVLEKAGQRKRAGWIIRVKSNADIELLDAWLDSVH